MLSLLKENGETKAITLTLSGQTSFSFVPEVLPNHLFKTGTKNLYSIYRNKHISQTSLKRTNGLQCYWSRFSFLSLSRSSCSVMSRALSCLRKPWLGRIQRR